MIETETVIHATPDTPTGIHATSDSPTGISESPRRLPVGGERFDSRAATHGVLRQRPLSDTDRMAAVRARPILTVAAVVECDGKFLFVEEQTRSGLRLNQPAGHVEAGESIPAAAVRETLEESGWDVDPVALVGVYHWEASDRGATFVRFTFAAVARRHDPERPLDTGIVRALWLTYEESAARAAQHRSPLVLRSLDDYRSGVRWPLDVIARL